jgi:hypothetical protein
MRLYSRTGFFADMRISVQPAFRESVYIDLWGGV